MINNAAQFEQEGDSLDKVLGDLEKQNSLKEASDAPVEKTTEESPAENKQETETQSSSGEVVKEDAKDESSEREDRAFNKRWKERLSKSESEWQARLEEQEKTFNERLQALTPTNQVPGWVRDIYGDSPEGRQFYEKYKAEEQAPLRENIKRELLIEQRQEVLKAKQEEEKWKDWVDEQLDELEDEGKKFDRNELMKVVLDYGPSSIDEDGVSTFDFRKGYAIYEKLQASSVNTEKSEARRKLAAATTSRTEGAENKPREYETSSTLKNKSWRDLLR